MKKKEPKELVSKKREEINVFRDELKSLSYSKLNSEAIRIAFKLMDEFPNTWQEALKTNKKHSAILELMKLF